MTEYEKLVDEVPEGKDKGDVLVHETDDENNAKDNEDGEDLVQEVGMEKEEKDMLALVPRHHLRYRGVPHHLIQISK